MKKRMNRILSALLVFALVLSTAQVVQASDEAETMGEGVQLTEDMPTEAAVDESESVQTEEVQTEEV